MSDFFVRKSQAYEDQLEIVVDPQNILDSQSIAASAITQSSSNDSSIPYSWHEENLQRQEEKFNKSLKEKKLKKKQSSSKEEKQRAIQNTILPSGQELNPVNKKPQYSPKNKGTATSITLAAFVPPPELRDSIQNTPLQPINMPLQQVQLQSGARSKKQKQPKYIQNEKLINKDEKVLYKIPKNTAEAKRKFFMACVGTLILILCAAIFVCIFIYATIQPSSP